MLLFYYGQKQETAYRGFKTYQMTSNPIDEIEMRVLSDDYLQTNPLAIGGDTNIIVVDGYVEAEESLAAIGSYTIFNQAGLVYSIGVIDSTGYYETLAPKNEPFSLEIFSFCGNSIASYSFPPQDDFSTLETINFVGPSGQVVTLSGILHNSFGSPLDNANVFIQSFPNNQNFETQTDENGFFLLQFLTVI